MSPILWSIVFAISFLIIFWLWAIAPSFAKRKELISLSKYDYAHRGLHNLNAGIPENSMAAFEQAVQAGFGIELDLQLTGDGRVVVHHDSDLKRSCGIDGIIANMPYNKISRYPIFGSDQNIPLFEDVLRNLGGAVPLMIEIKGYNDPADITAKVCKLLDGYSGDYMIKSFDPLIVRWLRKNRPDIIRGQLMEHMQASPGRLNASQAFFARNLFTNFYTRPHFESYSFIARNNFSLLTAKTVFFMSEASWTLRNEQDYMAAKKRGAMCVFEGFTPIRNQTLISVDDKKRKPKVCPADKIER